MTFPFSKVTITGIVTDVAITTTGSPPNVTVTDTILTISSSYGGTTRLTPGMTIVFASSFVGIESGKEYVISDVDFTSTTFKINENGVLKKAIDSYNLDVMFAAYLEFNDSTGPSVIFDTNKNNQGIVDYSQQLNRIVKLGEEEGFYTLSPYEYLGAISNYKNLVENGAILDQPTIQKSATKVARDTIAKYKKDFTTLPKVKD